MRGRVCLVTGANSGIGKATAQELARRGATLVMVCRDRGRGEEARGEIVEQTGNEAVELVLGDLGEMSQVRRVAREVEGRHPKLHVLVNNAGVYLPRRLVTNEGNEATLAINHLAPFLLTNLLMDPLRSAGDARVVTVSSAVHRNGRIDFSDLQAERRYGGFRSYCNSKLANVLFTYELARQLDGSRMTANCLHPGVIASGFAQDEPGMLNVLTKTFGTLLTPASKGARTSIFLASAAEVDGVTGKYFVRCKAYRSARRSYDEQLARRLWDVSAELTGLA